VVANHYEEGKNLKVCVTPCGSLYDSRIKQFIYDSVMGSPRV